MKIPFWHRDQFKKVYIIHRLGQPDWFGADFFIKTKKELTQKEMEKTFAGQYDVYWLSGCPHAREFIREHPEYKYVGSTDKEHLYGWNGWGVNFEELRQKGWKRYDEMEGKMDRKEGASTQVVTGTR